MSIPHRRRLPPPPPGVEQVSSPEAVIIQKPPPIPPRWTRPDIDLVRLLTRQPPLPPRQCRIVPHTSSSRVSQLHLEGAVPSLPGCLECRDFSQADAHALLFPRHVVTSLDNLAHDLTDPFINEIDKVRTIFTWLHHNIAYDVQSFFSKNLSAATPESTLSTGLAVCDGYAGLFDSLAVRVGIHSHRVSGHGKGFGYVAQDSGSPVPPYSSNHAWNCVFMDGNWHLIDTCWGAGAVDGTTYRKRFNPTFFTSSPAEFGRRHFPDDPSFQLIEGRPASWEDYIMEPAGPVIFEDFYRMDLSRTLLHPDTESVPGGQSVTFRIFKRCQHMSVAERDNFVFMVSVGDDSKTLELNSEGGWSTSVFIPRQSGEVTLFYVATVGGRDAKGIGIEAFRNSMGRHAISFGGLVRWTTA